MRIDRKSTKTGTEGQRYVSFYLRAPIDGGTAAQTMPNHRIRCIRETYRSSAGISFPAATLQGRAWNRIRRSAIRVDEPSLDPWKREISSAGEIVSDAITFPPSPTSVLSTC